MELQDFKIIHWNLLFEELDSIRLPQTKYLMTSFINFAVYKQSFASL